MQKTSKLTVPAIFLTLVCLLFSLSGTAISATMKMKMEKSLYSRLGGQKALVAVVDDFVNNVGGDKRINGFFAKTVASKSRLNHFKQNLTDFICMAAGGPCKYHGKNMKEAHAGMGITKADFGALVQDLVKTLNKFKVPAAEQKELLGLLGPLEPQIVEKM